MDYIDNWMKNTYTIASSSLNGKLCSSLFSNISHALISDFFKQWVASFTDKECYFYDVTSISSYSHNIPIVERGYNRDHDDLAQINLGMFCHSGSRLPVYYNVYNGSLTDKGNLSAVIDNAKDIGVEQVRLIMDGEFFDKERIKFLDNTEHTYIMGIPSHLKRSKEIIKEYGKNINEYEYKLKQHSEYCIDLKEKINNKEFYFVSMKL